MSEPPRRDRAHLRRVKPPEHTLLPEPEALPEPAPEPAPEPDTVPEPSSTGQTDQHTEPEPDRAPDTPAEEHDMSAVTVHVWGGEPGTAAGLVHVEDERGKPTPQGVARALTTAPDVPRTPSQDVARTTVQTPRKARARKVTAAAVTIRGGVQPELPGLGPDLSDAPEAFFSRMRPSLRKRLHIASAIEERSMQDLLGEAVAAWLDANGHPARPAPRTSGQD